jgi:hypothetical protein
VTPPRARPLPALALAFALAACRREASAPPASATPAPRAQPTVTPYVAAQNAGPDFIDQQIALRLAEYAGHLAPALPLVRGALPQGGVGEHAFEIVAGHCYRIIAVGGVEAQDLDLVLYAPDGTVVDEDTRRDSDPVLGNLRPLCPPTSGRYRVEVRMITGQGDYGVQVLGTP